MPDPDRRVVVQVAFPADPGKELLDIVRVAPSVDVIPCGYFEPSELRTARARGEITEAQLALVPVPTPEQRDAFARAEVLLTMDLPMAIDELAPNLRWVQGIGAGIDMYNGARLPSGVVVTNAAGISAVPMAEFVIARVLSVWKRFPELAELQQRHEWKPAYGALFAGSTLGIVGFGAIGVAIAERARAFGARVVASRRRPELGDGGTGLVDEMLGPDQLHALLAQCDSVVVAAPATSETRDLFDAAAFAAMKPGAVFCNVGRGSLVDEDALLDTVRSGHLRAAILDVTRYEPLPPDNPLWDEPSVLLSPHSSATADRYPERLYELFADNLRRYLAGEPLRNVVDHALVFG